MSLRLRAPERAATNGGRSERSSVPATPQGTPAGPPPGARKRAAQGGRRSLLILKLLRADLLESAPTAPRHDMLDPCLHSRLAEEDAGGNTVRDILPGR